MRQLFSRSVRWPTVSMVTGYKLDHDISFLVDISDALKLDLSRGRPLVQSLLNRIIDLLLAEVWGVVDDSVSQMLVIIKQLLKST